MRSNTLFCTLLLVLAVICTIYAQKEPHPNSPSVWMKIGSDSVEFDVSLPQPGSIQVVITQDDDGVSITSGAQAFQKDHKVILDHLLPEKVYSYSVVYKRLPGEELEVIKAGTMTTGHPSWNAPYTVRD